MTASTSRRGDFIAGSKTSERHRDPLPPLRSRRLRGRGRRSLEDLPLVIWLLHGAGEQPIMRETLLANRGALNFSSRKRRRRIPLLRARARPTSAGNDVFGEREPSSMTSSPPTTSTPPAFTASAAHGSNCGTRATWRCPTPSCWPRGVPVPTNLPLMIAMTPARIAASLRRPCRCSSSPPPTTALPPMRAFARGSTPSGLDDPGGRAVRGPLGMTTYVSVGDRRPQRLPARRALRAEMQAVLDAAAEAGRRQDLHHLPGWHTVEPAPHSS